MTSGTEMDWQQEVIIKASEMDEASGDAEADPTDSKTCRKLGALSHHIMSFMNQPELSDILLRFAGKQYRAHRLILCAWSPVLEEKLSEAAKAGKSRGDPSQPMVLDLDEDATVPSDDSNTGDVDASFEQFLRFLYSGKANLTEETVKLILNLAQAFKIQPLQEMCEQYIGKVIGKHNVEKALEWLGAAERKGLPLLQENCVKVLRAYFQFIPDKVWQRLRLDQLISIIESSEVIVEDEYALFSKIETWIKSEQVKDTDLWVSLEQILPHIRFAHMTVLQLQQFDKSRLGQLISQKHPEIVADAIQARALASEEMDFSEVSEHRFVPPRLYLKFIPPGGRTSSSKEASKDVYARMRCSNTLTGYTDRRASVWRKRKGGLYRLAEGEFWEVSVISRQNPKGEQWGLQFLIVPRKEHISENFRLALSIKIKEDVHDPINIVYSGTVAKSPKRGAADGLVLSTPFDIENKIEYIYLREVVFID